MLQDRPRGVNLGADLVTVYISQGHLAARVIKAKLEAEGIPALLNYDSAGLVFGLTVDGLGEVRVMVPAAYQEQATEVLHSLTPEEQAALETEGEEEPPSANED
ncbi:MAG: DUF2007 domain-containing protein [Chloroflexi bacterium]|nr:DUF2007 domain-containing protein [Chloroflexota bacterium]